MKHIKSDQPQLQVLLTKVIHYRLGQAERYRAANNPIDITHLLSDQSTVFTHKNLNQPMGTFQLTVMDRLHGDTGDSLYGLVSPMDHIEIRASREPWRYAGKALPVLMRGFVATIKRSQQIASDGRPVRAVIIQGQDYGKLLSILQIFYERNYGLGQNLITTFKLSDNFGVSFKAFRSKDFINELLQKVVNPEIKKLWQASRLVTTLKQPLQIKFDGSVDDGSIQPYSVQPYQGSVWGLMKQFADLPWNELFIEDREDGVYLVYRPMPFKTSQGSYIKPGKHPGTVALSPVDIKTIDIARSDEGIANYFWVAAPRAQLARAGDLQNDAFHNQDDYFLQNHANCDPTFYGIRKMEVQTQQAATLEDSAGVHLPEQAQVKANQRMDEWVHDRRSRLVEYNKDNVLLENGTATVKGNEDLRAGRYIQIDYGVYAAEYYLTGVAHTYKPFQSFESQVTLARGTSFIERTKLQQSPYLAEKSGGVYG